MRFSMSIGQGDVAAPPSPAPGGLPSDAAADVELRLLEHQLERMRGMLFEYSRLFFSTIRNWTFLSIGLLVLGWGGVLPAAVVPVPFIVPFAFLETGYLFWYTVFARRHAERLEQAINERLGRDVLVAHRLEAAYFYPPDATKVAALSFGNPAGFMSAMTIGYTVGAALVWAAGLASTAAYMEIRGVAPWAPDLILRLVVPGAIAWTAAIAAYLVWTFVRRPDEERLLAVLDESYRLPAAPMPAAPTPPSGTLDPDPADVPSAVAPEASSEPVAGAPGADTSADGPAPGPGAPSAQGR